jgi:hypothetical protein
MGACFVWCIFTKEKQMDEALQFIEKSGTLNFLKPPFFLFFFEVRNQQDTCPVGRHPMFHNYC